MRPFGRLVLPAASLRTPDVDTDQLVPARFLFRPRAQGFADQLFHDLRFDSAGRPRDDFVLNRRRAEATGCLVTGPNFGCGSSRESAVWALSDYGIRCVIGTSFGDIFFNNCQKNGLLPVRLEAQEVDRLHARLEAQPDASIEVDLPAQTVSLEGCPPMGFAMDPFRKRLLIEGKDDIALTLGMTGRLAQFEQAYDNGPGRHLAGGPDRPPS